MKFIVFVIDKLENPGTEYEMNEITRFNNKLRANNNWVMAAGISMAPEAKLIDFSVDKSVIKEGSLISGELNYSGFWIISAENVDEAISITKEASKACNRAVEIRPFLD